MYNLLTRAQQALKLRFKRHIRVKAFCAIICVVLSSTVFIYNAFAFFTENDDEAAGSAADAGFSLNAALLLWPQQILAPFGQEKSGADVPGFFNIHIRVDDKTIETISAGETVEDILLRSGVLLTDTDEVVPSPATQVTGETSITVLRIRNYTEEVLEPIPFETIRKPSDKLSAGESVVVQKGADGQKKNLYEVYTRNGVETLRHVLEETVVKEPVPEILEYGTGGTVTAMGQTYAYKKVLNVTASAYTTQNKKWKRTASGTTARVGAIAVDPKVIPMGTKMLITSPDGKSWVYGVAVAEDTGGTIKGNKIDLFFNTRAECLQFGVKKAKVYILD